MDDAQAVMSHVGCYQWRTIYSLILRDTNPFQITHSRTQGGFEPAVPGSERPQTDASDGVAAGIVEYRVFQKDLDIFYSGHRGHRT